MIFSVTEKKPPPAGATVMSPAPVGSTTFSGLAGVGDLTATVLAPSGRNRRAGELLGRGTPAEEIPALIGQASEGLDAVPLLATAIETSGSPAEALGGLAALIRGEVDTEAWVDSLRLVERSRKEAA